MNYFQQLAQSFATELVRPRKYNYSEEILQNFFADHPHLSCRFTKVTNKRHELIETLLVKKHVNNLPSKACILYAHGLGSNKLQVLSILKHLRAFPYDVCSFDFSGSGKSEGKFTSYGLREKDDVCAVLAWLDEMHHYDEYILWGRSMGSVAIILSQALLLNPKVSTIILDSPFSSFQKVSLQIASKKSFIPQIFLQPLLSYLKEHFSKKAEFNPFSVKVEEAIKKIDRKILFVYSKIDTVVSFTHSQDLKKSCKHTPQEVQIDQDHNMQRSKQTHLKIYAFIVKNSFEKPIIKEYETSDGFKLDQTMKFQSFTNRGKSFSKINRGISVTSKDSLKENIQIQANKGRKSTGNSNAKINLVITQSMQLNRKNSIRQSWKETKLRPSQSIRLGHHHSEQQSEKSIAEKSTQKQSFQPSSIISFNSVDTIESNNEEQPLRQDSETNRIRYTPSHTYDSMDMSLRLGGYLNTENQSKNALNNFSNRVENHQNQSYLEKLNHFYSASFMDENMNLLCSINSICLNRKRDKENAAKELNPTIQKEKTMTYNTVNSSKRPSIQLRRKNRFVV